MAESSQNDIQSWWGKDQFADATIIMGQKTWRVHRVVICNQSKYFAKALEGYYMEARNKTIDLMDSDFLEEEVDGLLRYLYTRQLDARQQRQPVRTFVVADYFQVGELRDKAARAASCELQALINKKYFVIYRDRCRAVLDQYPDTDLEAAIIKVIAGNIQVVKHESEAAWGELTTAYPTLAKKVLDVLFPEPAPVPVTSVKRPASVAFDDTLQVARSSRLRPSVNRLPSASMLPPPRPGKHH